MLSFRNDFNQALKFISILDTVATDGVEPLGNVLEVYGGNGSKMRCELGEKDDQTIDFKKELERMNAHFKGDYVVLKKSKAFDPDCE